MSKIFDLIEQEKTRQFEGLELIPSENYVSTEVLKVVGSILTDKYSEGYPGNRYYAGNEIIDEIEEYTKSLANQLFGTKHAIVQPYSGSPANLAVDLGLASVGDPVLGLSLTSGGHLTHGASVSYTGKLFKAVNYSLNSQGKIDFDQVRALALEHKPKIIWAGLTAYPYKLEFDKFASIATEVGAYLVADISHIAGLVVAGEHQSPVEYVDVITSTTHKTLRGPRGAMILITDKGIKKDPDIISKLEKSVFPGLQGGPHNHVTAAMAIAFEEAMKSNYKQYITQVVKNAQVLAQELDSPTENHLLLLDLTEYGFGMGYQAQIALELAGITVNKNTIPHDSASPLFPSGVRIGTPAVTSRGMKETEMKQIAAWIKRALEEIKGHDLPQDKTQRSQFIKQFKQSVKDNPKLAEIKDEVREFTKAYLVPGF